jgi:hypothetical protein
VTPTRGSTPPDESGSDGGTRFLVRLTVNGNVVGLKPFLHDMLGGAIEGLISGLRDIHDSETILLEVRVKPPCE